VPHVALPKLFPESSAADVPRSRASITGAFMAPAVASGRLTSHFDYTGGLTAVCSAPSAFACPRKSCWDAEKLQITNNSTAQSLVSSHRRSGNQWVSLVARNGSVNLFGLARSSDRDLFV
jgi:hypothetical protein